MKNFTLLAGLMLFAICSFAQKITRGPEVGEIYILGLSKSGLDATIYRSTDFGQTIECVDSISQNTYWIETIEADKTPGVLYFVTAFGGLHYSNNFGQYGSWDYRQTDISRNLHAGLVEGQVYNTFHGHSNDFGENFISHTCNGVYGGLESSEIDEQQDVGYIFVTKWGIGDSLYFLKTTDDFENLQTDTIFNYTNYEFIKLTRGTNEGEIYFYNHMTDELWRSTEQGANWHFENKYNFSNEFEYRKGVIGGKQDGEVYVVLHSVSNMWMNVNTYVLHSLNSGKTFTLFHPLSKGEQPILSNFSTINTEGAKPLSVEFSNYSIGNIVEYNWDFDDDGIIDSFEEIPTWIYPDTGYYSVRLTIFDGSDSNTFLRENYIHVKTLVEINEFKYESVLNCYPNPFDNKVTITIPNDFSYDNLSIYNLAGNIVGRLNIQQCIKKVIWDGTDQAGNKCSPGIYYITLEKGKYSSKILLID